MNNDMLYISLTSLQLPPPLTLRKNNSCRTFCEQNLISDGKKNNIY